MRTLQDLSDVSDSVATVPALVPDEPNTAWLFPVAVAPKPKIREPVKLPEDVSPPTLELYAPDVLSNKQRLPTATFV